MNKRTLILLITTWTGFTSGLPLALSGGTLQAWLTQANISITLVGASSILTLPYVYKFMWAPFLDRYTLPFLKRRTGWMAFTQCAIALTLLILSYLHPGPHLVMIAIMAFLIATFSATQDIAIDAYRTELLTPTERGLGSACYTAGYRIAMLVSGGLALIIADYVGFSWMFRIMAITMLSMAWITQQVPEHTLKTREMGSPYHLLKVAIRNFIEQPHPYTILSFIVLYKFGESLASNLTMYFLLHYLNYSLSAIGSVYKITGLLGTLTGVFAGGFFYKKIGLRKSLLWFGLAQALGWMPYIYLAASGKSMLWLIIAVGTEAVTSGMATSALLALLMTLCDTRYTATQFAFFSAIGAIGRVVTGPIAGGIVLHIGWIGFFALSALVSLPALWLLRVKGVISHRF